MVINGGNGAFCAQFVCDGGMNCSLVIGRRRFATVRCNLSTFILWERCQYV